MGFRVWRKLRPTKVSNPWDDPWTEEDELRSRQQAWDRRVSYAQRVAVSRPARAAPPRGQQEETDFAIWLWAMAQPLRGLNRQEVERFAQQFDLYVLERPVGPTLQIFGEAYSAPGSIAVQYDDTRRGTDETPRGVVVEIAVEGIWPNG